VLQPAISIAGWRQEPELRTQELQEFRSSSLTTASANDLPRSGIPHYSSTPLRRIPGIEFSLLFYQPSRLPARTRKKSVA